MPAKFDAVKRQFAQTFGAGGTLHVVRAPGRVNLIGEHTDYNDGFVFPMAIEPHVDIVFRARTDGKVRLASDTVSGSGRGIFADRKDHPRRAENGRIIPKASPPS